MAHKETNTVLKEVYYINHFHALDSISDKTREEMKKINTDALIEIFGTYYKTADKEWLVSSIETAMDESDEAKQIYNLAETFRIEYINASVSDVKSINDAFQNSNDERQKRNADYVCSYLLSSLHCIDLLEVAKELIIRYKKGSLFLSEN